MNILTFFIVMIVAAVLFLAAWYIFTGTSRGNASLFLSRFYQFSATEDLVTGLLLQKMRQFSERGKWLAFAGAILLLGEVFYYTVMLLESYSSGIFNADSYQHAGALVFLFIGFLLIVASMRLASGDRDLPDAFGNPSASEMWEEKYKSMTQEDKQSFLRFILDRHSFYESLTIFSSIALSAMLTLLLVWFAGWLGGIFL